MQENPPSADNHDKHENPKLSETQKEISLFSGFRHFRDFVFETVEKPFRVKPSG